MSRTLFTILGITCCMLTTACSMTPRQTAMASEAPALKINRVAPSIACASLPQTASLHHVRSVGELQTLQASLSSQLGSENRTLQTEQFSTLLATDDLVVINMGQKSTGGYTLELLSTHLSLEDNDATIKVRWKPPAKGRVVKQALTQPCLAIQIPRINYDTLYILNQDGQLLFSHKN